MHSQYAQSATALPQAPLSQHGPLNVGAKLRAALDILFAPGRKYLERRRDIQELQSLTDMDAHMLKDIGAAAWMVARAQDRANEYQRRAEAFYPSRTSID